MREIKFTLHLYICVTERQRETERETEREIEFTIHVFICVT